MDCFVASLLAMTETVRQRRPLPQFGFGGASAARTCQNFRRRRALSTVSLPYCSFAFASSWRPMLPEPKRRRPRQQPRAHGLGGAPQQLLALLGRQVDANAGLDCKLWIALRLLQ